MRQSSQADVLHVRVSAFRFGNVSERKKSTIGIKSTYNVRVQECYVHVVNVQVDSSSLGLELLEEYVKQCRFLGRRTLKNTAMND